MAELTLGNKATGQLWTLAPQGCLKFKINKAGSLSFFEGDEVLFQEDGKVSFSGWVFTKVKNRWEEIEVTCYDRLRYFKANASYAFYGMSAGEILTQIAGDLQVATGTIDDTGYKLPSMIEEDQSCLDILAKAVQQTLLNTGRLYVLYDDGQGVSLRDVQNLASDKIIGDTSLLTEYSYKTDIDAETYNSIKLSRPNENTGRADTFVALDSANIGRWGLLQLYQTVDGDLNDAQAKAQAEATLKYYNRRMRTLSVDSLGVPGLRAGQLVPMVIPGLGDISLDQYCLIEQITHTYRDDEHTMSFEIKAI